MKRSVSLFLIILAIICLFSCLFVANASECRHEDYLYLYDEREHWFSCLFCGQLLYAEPHWALCGEDDDCWGCGVDNGIISIIYHQTEDLYFDKKEHWFECTICEETFRSEHWAYCDEPDVCAECGCEYSGDEILHTIIIYSNENEHWEVCTSCGEEVYRGTHWAWCNDTITCGLCKYKRIYSDDELYHSRVSWEYDNEMHWGKCTYCSQQTKEPHFDAEVQQAKDDFHRKDEIQNLK